MSSTQATADNIPTTKATRTDDKQAVSIRSYLPAILTIVGALLMGALRIQVGGDHFISDGALMMLALACYLTAAVFHLMNLYAPSEMAQKVGLWTASLGVFFNLSSWLVRWVAAHDREVAILRANRHAAEQMPSFWRYIPFANLYDLSLAFAFGAGITTLLIAHRRNFRFLGAVSLPLASIILLLARFIGNEFIDLPPILDSYWRPIHVGVASLSYGVTLVCFAVAVVYLLKEGVKTEAMAIWSSIFSILVIGSVGLVGALSVSSLVHWSVYTSGVYRSATVIMGESARQTLPLRVDIPYVGPVLVLAALLLVGVIIAFGVYLAKQNEQARVWGHRLLKLALVAQAAGIALLISQVKTLTNLTQHIDPRQYEQFGRWLAERSGATKEQLAQASPELLIANAQDFVANSGSRLALSLNANPVELAALITALVATLFVIIFSFRTEKLREMLPPLDKLDSLMYKTASVAFAGLAILLITGAVWANESWGHYWSWDSKETGALVAWLTYAAFLHTRISRGWKGRSSAYFAIIGFL
ncbi:MAG: cytochrome c biogenesis protein CcsA, partial [Acidobacteria bacterium]|nr:cytochrome c biogenesis protein CcsA [Acidobacteriota bacterium]